MKDADGRTMTDANGNVLEEEQLSEESDSMTQDIDRITPGADSQGM